MNMKPILFNAPRVCAILEDHKTVTRRTVKGYALDHLELDTDGSIIGVYNQDELSMAGGAIPGCGSSNLSGTRSRRPPHEPPGADHRGG